MAGWWRIFARRRPRESLDSLRSRIGRFRSLLDQNNAALEMMAEAGEALGGDLLFDSSYLHQLAGRFGDSVRSVVTDLNLITSNGHPELMEAFERIRGSIDDVLEGRSSAPDVPFTLPMSELSDDLAGAAGEKMAHLGEIRSRLGFRVPDGFVVTSRACTRLFDRIGMADRIRSGGTDEEEPRDVGARLGGLVEGADLPRDVSRSIARAVSGLSRRSDGPSLFAVRSSAIGEDGELSFAGLHETFLAVRPRDVADRYRKVVASLFSPAAIAYRREHGEPLESASMAVGCMLMVPALAGGVVYTMDPEDPARDAMIVSASPGLGTSVVGGGSATDQFTLSRVSPHRVLSSSISHKDEMQVVDPAGGVRPEPVPVDRRDEPAVTDAFLSKLAGAALAIERYMKCAQDIEWARDRDGEPVILQARPLRLRADRAEYVRMARQGVGKHRVLLSGLGTIACRGIGSGQVVMVSAGDEGASIPPGGVLVSRVSSPRLAEMIPRASAVLTDIGSSTGHMATIAREFRVPAIVDLQEATGALVPGMDVTVDAEENVVYEGRVEELLRYRNVMRSSFVGSREFRLLRRMLRHVTPMNLGNPSSSAFTARACRTYHDVIRFAHSKAVEYLLEGYDVGAHGHGCPEVEMDVPLDLRVIDIGGGLLVNGSTRTCGLDRIACTPLRALLEGLNAPGAWSTEPASMDLDSFMSSALAPSVLSGPSASATARNVAIVSDHYLNLNLYLGYHYSQVDSYVSDVRNDNHAYFRFFGGMTDAARRARRARMISIVLERHDFLVEVSGDFIIGRLKKFDTEAMLQRMAVLGLLIGFTRQLDVSMRADSSIGSCVDDFMRLVYSIPARS